MGATKVVDREALSAALDALDAAFDEAAEFDCETLTAREQLALLERFERLRRLPAIEHRLINSIARQATAEELGGKLSHAIAEWTLTSRAEASRRVREAADLGPRHGLGGEPLPPVLEAAAAQQRAGDLGAGQVAVIRRFHHQLPGFIDDTTRTHAETRLAREGTQYRPEQLAQLANTLADCLDPDGAYTDEDRARRRGVTLGNQEADGMSALRG